MRILFVVYDEANILDFPIGIASLAKALIVRGCEVEIYNQDFNHIPDEHLTEYLNKNKFDVVGIGVIGGHGPSPDPVFFLNKTKADAIVIKNGYQRSIELIDGDIAGQILSKGADWRTMICDGMHRFAALQA